MLEVRAAQRLLLSEADKSKCQPCTSVSCVFLPSALLCIYTDEVLVSKANAQSRTSVQTD